MITRSLWTCPECGRQFSAKNTQHSCGKYKIEDHFKNKDPHVRDLYDHLLATLETIGQVKVFAVKTRIIFQAETQFAAAMPHKHWLDGAFWLKRQARHPLITRIEMGVFRDYGHYFRLTQPEDVDEDLAELLAEAYAIGSGAFQGWR